MTNLTVRVVGRPAPQGSHEVGANGHVMHSSRYLEGWRMAVNRSVRQAYLLRGMTGADMPFIPGPRPVYVHITHFVLDEQCRAEGTDDPTGAPDLDKLVRATIDGLGEARVFHNDSQVVAISATKERVTDGAPPGALVIITDHPENDRHKQGEREHMTYEATGDYRLVLQRVSADDETGERKWETLVEVTDSAESLTETWLPAAQRRLGGEPRIVAIEPDDITTETLAAARERFEEAQPVKRKRRTKAEMEAARAVEAAPAHETAEPAPAVLMPTTPEAQPAVAPPSLPQAEAPRFNPFATS